MKVLARFPALDAAAITIAGAATASAVAEPRTAAAVSGPMPPPETLLRRPRTPPRRPRNRFPGGSVVALAALAVIAWTLASWNDARRAERSRAERLARMQSTFSTPGALAR